MSYTDLPEIKELFSLEHQLSCLSVYRDVAEDPLIKQFRAFLSGLCSPLRTIEDSMSAYAAIVSEIICADADGSFSQIIATKILENKNPLNRLLAEGSAAKHSLATSQLSDMATHDLHTLQKLAQIHSPQIKKLLSGKAWDQKRTDLRDPIASLPVWQTGDTYTDDARKTRDYNDLLSSFVKNLQANGAWSRLLPELFSYHQKHGIGKLSPYTALRARPDGLSPYPYIQETATPEHPAIRKILNRFTAGQKTEHLILLSDAEFDLTGLVDGSAKVMSEDGVQFIYVEPHRPDALERLMNERLEFKQRFVIVVASIELDSNSETERAFYADLRALVTRQQEQYMIIALHELSREIQRNGTLIDCETLAADADPRMKKLIRAFGQVIDLTPREEAVALPESAQQEKEMTD